VSNSTGAGIGSGPFIHAGDIAWDRMAEGVRRQILGYGPDLMLVRVEFEQGAVGAMHQHPHRQVTYVVAGSFETTIAGVTRVLGPGDSFFVLADLPHGVVALEPGTLIDVFTPAREDFVK
jgi:quercetin dioxygenase-like cupin family protein